MVGVYFFRLLWAFQKALAMTALWRFVRIYPPPSPLRNGGGIKCETLRKGWGIVRFRFAP